MKISKTLPLIVLAGLVGCSTAPKKVADFSHYQGARYLASMDETLNNKAKLAEKIDKLMNGVFHSYMMGQIYLYDFDKQLDKNPGKAMRTDAYNSLLAIRSYVDSFEHEINDLYIDLVLATALPRYTEEQRVNAQEALDAIGKFMDGVKSDKKELPENLKPLVLGNLREKQTELFEELKALHDDVSVTGNDEHAKDVIHKNMVLLRATRMSYYKDLKDYHVDEKVLAQAIKEEKKKKSYKELEAQIKDLSKKMKEFTSEMGRGTSSDTIFPSATTNGNISGTSYPAKTWSLTFDDGPAGTTPEVLANLKNKGIPATFFMLAQQVQRNPKTSQAVKESGNVIACHSFTHAQLTKVGPVQLEKEITTATKVIEDQLGVDIKLFRLPYGAGTGNTAIRQKIAANNLVHVFWTVDTLDWQDKNPQSILARALKQMNGSSKNAGIILFHDIHKQSVAASALLMDYFNAHKDLNICTVQGVVDQINKGLPSCK